MGKWDQNNGDGEPVLRTLYDRRKHEGLIPTDELKPTRILIQPCSTSGDRKVGENLPIFTVTSDPPPPSGSRPVSTVKFTASLPDHLPEGSFVKKWFSIGNSSRNDPEDDLSLPVSSALESPEPKESEKLAESSSSRDSDSSSEAQSRTRGSPQTQTVAGSTEVVPLDGVDSNVVHPVSASRSTSETSTGSASTGLDSSASTSDTSEDNDPEIEKFGAYQDTILKLFDIGDRDGVRDVVQMNLYARRVDNFYELKKSMPRGLVLKPCSASIQADLKGFAKTPVAIGTTLRCHITRCATGMERSLYPNYFMYLEEDDTRQDKKLILSARKRKKSATSNYLISVDPAQIGRRSSAYVGKVRGNLFGTEFTIFDGGNNPKRFNYTELGIQLFNYRRELGVVVYETNMLGFKGPRRMKLLVPAMLGESDRCECRPDIEDETILEISKKRHLPPTLVGLENKAPHWSTETQSYVLNFRGRVTLPSVKNFQIVHPDKPDYLILQFGRIDEHNFTLDFRYPLCPLQAFGVALTSFDGKIACE